MKKIILIFSLPVILIFLSLLQLTGFMWMDIWLHLITAVVFVLVSFIQLIVKTKILGMFLIIKYVTAIIIISWITLFAIPSSMPITNILFELAPIIILLVNYIFVCLIGLLFAFEFREYIFNQRLLVINKEEFKKNMIILFLPVVFVVLIILQWIWLRNISQVFIIMPLMLFVILSLIQPLVKFKSKKILTFYLMFKYAIAFSIVLVLTVIVIIRGNVW